MSAPKRAVPTKRGRYYTDPKDTDARYVSVTNVIDTALSKPALVGWAAKTVAQEAVTNLVDVVRMARTDGEAAVSWLKGRPYAQRDAAAKLGSRIHDLAEAHALGQDLGDYSDDPDVVGMVENYLAFREDWQPEYEATEATVVNRSIGYAGTLDGLLRIPELGDGLKVVDYKSGRTGPYPEWAVQLAAYASAEALWLPDDSEIAMPAVDGGLILRIRPDGYSLHEVKDLAPLLDVFAHMVEITRWSHAADDAGAISDPLIPAAAAAAPQAV